MYPLCKDIPFADATECATVGLLKERFQLVRINWLVFSGFPHHTFVYGVTELERKRTDSKFKANSKEGIAL